MIENEEVHIPKECLVAGLAEMNDNTASAMQPLLMASCSKIDVDSTIILIESVNEEMKLTIHQFPLMNVSTHGDGTRRIAANKMVAHDTAEYEWNKHVDGLPLMDYEVGPDGITFNFDPKHKRLWRAFISEKININGIRITKKLLKEFLDGNSFGKQNLYPKDKQNVEAATKFHLVFIEMAEKGQLSIQLSANQIRN